MTRVVWTGLSLFQLTALLLYQCHAAQWTSSIREVKDSRSADFHTESEASLPLSAFVGASGSIELAADEADAAADTARKRNRLIRTEHSNRGQPEQGSLADVDSQGRREQLPNETCTFTTWSRWTECSLPCGGGVTVRSRKQKKIEKRKKGNDKGRASKVGNGHSLLQVDDDESGQAAESEEPGEVEAPCDSSGLNETKPCNTFECSPKDCQWSTWTTWSSCSSSCGGGTHRRSRNIIKQVQPGGRPCTGGSSQEDNCQMGPCPINCAWGNWSDWSECTASCGGGSQGRYRSIIAQAKHGGNACLGGVNETRRCGQEGCPVHCRLSEWTGWTKCTKSCGGGESRRTRIITVPASDGGSACNPNREEHKVCNPNGCPVDCIFSAWTAWTSCSRTCGGGLAWRRRNEATEAQSNGKPCIGDKKESQKCGMNACPVNCAWADWTEWTACSSTCGVGLRHRSRKVKEHANFGGNPCEGLRDEVEGCSSGGNQTNCTSETPATNFTRFKESGGLTVEGSLELVVSNSSAFAADRTAQLSVESGVAHAAGIASESVHVIFTQPSSLVETLVSPVVAASFQIDLDRANAARARLSSSASALMPHDVLQTLRSKSAGDMTTEVQAFLTTYGAQYTMTVTNFKVTSRKDIMKPAASSSSSAQAASLMIVADMMMQMVQGRSDCLVGKDAKTIRSFEKAFATLVDNAVPVDSIAAGVNLPGTPILNTVGSGCQMDVTTTVDVNVADTWRKTRGLPPLNATAVALGLDLMKFNVMTETINKELAVQGAKYSISVTGFSSNLAAAASKTASSGKESKELAAEVKKLSGAPVETASQQPSTAESMKAIVRNMSRALKAPSTSAGDISTRTIAKASAAAASAATNGDITPEAVEKVVSAAKAAKGNGTAAYLNLTNVSQL
eukprot:TRINITY_DN9143_c0_g3_i1.p1 TRINITY_DN9143_c0_g3~~TRINITY_DN9143_c0_g3_i1.p1  ORF type:complete len:906 (-),score=162.43 TRINITY_DN9143_c0_g3_i1:130-2847(-)